MINADEDEIARFEALAHRWWDTDGEFRALHDIQGPRVEYLKSRCQVAGRRALDVGCGGGLVTEALHDLGASVTGIDAGEKPLAVARLHALERGIDDEITYTASTPESFLAAAPGQFGVVTCLEMLEHVPDPPSTVQALAELAEPGGDVVLSTISRTPKAWAFAIVGAEYVLNVLPKGTHAYEKLIRPSELARACRDAGLVVADVAGLEYNPFTRRCHITRNVDVNYMLHAKKPPAEAPQ